MNSIQKLIHEHKPIGIYDLESENSLILAELETYAAALQFIDDSADELLKEMFFSTAEEAGAERFRSLYACDYEGDISKRYLRAVMAHKEPFWNSELWNFERALEDLSVTEYIVDRTLLIRNFSSFSLQKQKNVMALLRKYAPAHMAVNVIENARSWDELDALNRSFSDSDSVGLTFAQLKM